MNKKILLIPLIIFFALIIFLSKDKLFQENTQNQDYLSEMVQENPEYFLPTEEKVFNLCFYKEEKVSEELSDVSMLKMTISGNSVSGTYRNIPAEKDSKIGDFSGTVGIVVPEIMGRIADVWWNSFAEGMQTKEELRIIFGEGNASVGYGEMVDRGDGVYIYKNKDEISFWQDLTDVSCDFLDDKIIVEKYIKDNIKSLVEENPVLGGSWFAYNIKVNPNNKSGEFTYEDGHILGKMTFEYERNFENIIIKNVTKIN